MGNNMKSSKGRTIKTKKKSYSKKSYSKKSYSKKSYSKKINIKQRASGRFSVTRTRPENIEGMIPPEDYKIILKVNKKFILKGLDVEFELRNKIGEGGQGSIWLAKITDRIINDTNRTSLLDRNNLSEYVTIKFIKSINIRDAKLIKSELRVFEILSKNEHCENEIKINKPNVILSKILCNSVCYMTLSHQLQYAASIMKKI